jgi:hypothetical protein
MAGHSARLAPGHSRRLASPQPDLTQTAPSRYVLPPVYTVNSSGLFVPRTTLCARLTAPLRLASLDTGRFLPSEYPFRLTERP